jgi:hypothetical protein
MVTFKAKTQSMKETIDKLEFIKIKNFFWAKDTAKRKRRQAKDWEKIFAKEVVIVTFIVNKPPHTHPPMLLQWG